MKNIKWSSIVIAICYIAAGVLFFTDANITKELICTWIGYGLIAVGLIYIISYFTRPIHIGFLKNEFMTGLIIVTLGVMPLVKREIFIELVYFALAVLIMISGYRKLQDCVDSWRLGLKNGVLYFVLAAISIVIGAVILLDTTIDVKPLNYLIGSGLLYSGLSDLISTIFLSKKVHSYVKEMNSGRKEKFEVPKADEDKPEETIESEVVEQPQVDETIFDDNNNNPEV